MIKTALSKTITLLTIENTRGIDQDRCEGVMSLTKINNEVHCTQQHCIAALCLSPFAVHRSTKVTKHVN